MPLWLLSAAGCFLAIVGTVLLVWEWINVFDTQGNTLARDNLRLFLWEWRNAADTPHGGTAAETREANIRRMRLEVQKIKGYQQGLYRRYVCMLANDIAPTDQVQLDGLDRAFDMGTGIDEEENRPRRRRLMVAGAVLIVVGTVSQMLGSYQKPFGPFCDTKEWKCPP